MWYGVWTLAYLIADTKIRPICGKVKVNNQIWILNVNFEWFKLSTKIGLWYETCCLDFSLLNSRCKNLSMIGLGVVVVVARLSILSDPIWMHQLRGNMHFRVFTSYFHGIKGGLSDLFIFQKIQFPFLRLSLLLTWFIFERSVGVTISCGLIVLLIQRGMLIWPLISNCLLTPVTPKPLS